MLCKGSHLTHLFPRMDEASKFLEDMTISHPQLPVVYRKLTLDPHVVYGMINPAPSSINLIDHVVNLVTSLVKPIDQVVDPIPSSVNPTLPLKSETQVVDLIPSLVNPTLPPESETQVVDPSPPVDPILPLENETQVVDLILSSVNPTLPQESKPDIAHIFLIDTDYTMLGGIPLSPMEPPPSNEAIHFDWGELIGPCLTSHIPFQITMKFCGWNVPQMLIDEATSISILSSFAWQYLGCPQLAPVMQNMLAFKRRTSQPLGTLP
jgi:hypothetical protein